MFQKIIVPIDIDDMANAERCLNMAKELANRESEIWALHVIEDIPPHVRAFLPENAFEAARNRAQEDLRERLENFSFDASIDVRIGKPASAIVDFATEKDADLIVIGSGMSDLATYLIGSTATRVVQHATCPVLVVK